MNDVNHTLEKEQILKSTDILNLLGNLYALCAREFTGIYNHIQNDREGRLDFFTIFQACQEEIRQICEEQGTFDVFKLEIKGILDKLPVHCKEERPFKVTAWALLKALDISMGEAPHHLSAMDSVMICKASPALGNHRFRLLFKPQNLIWETLQEADITIRTGDKFGNRIEDHLKKLIFYSEDLNLTRRIKINRLNKKVDILLARRESELAIAISPICCSFNYSFESFRSNGTVPYVFSGIKNKEKIMPYIDRVLNQCLEENVAIVVFPELTIDSDLRQHIADWLRLNNSEQRILMVIAGSFHFPVNGKNGKYVNSSVAFMFDGQELWKQEKMHQFMLTDKEIKKMFENSRNGGSFKEMFKKGDTEARECIEISDTLEVIESSIGRMATLICLDFIVKEKVPLVVDTGINMIFAPTMSRTLSRMIAAAREFGTNQQASVFCANSCWVISGGRLKDIDNNNTGFIYTPTHRGNFKIDCQRKNCAECKLHYIRVENLKKIK